jgi:uncharacterized protein (TIGR03083 family)
MALDIWPVIHAERAALAADLADLTAAQWATPSLCTGWSIEQCLGHQVGTALMSPTKFFRQLVGAGFSFTRFADKQIAAATAQGPAGTLAAFVAVQDTTVAPLGPKMSWVGEALVHGEDIRHPLGIPHDYPLDWVTRSAEFYAGSNALIGGKKRVAGVTLKATDADWTHGTGPTVEGPAVALMMTTTGRTAYLEQLTGPGVELLRAR